MGDEKYKILSDNLKGGDNLGDLVLNGRVVIKWILKMSGVRVWNAII
jgi:hypothetical protein